MIQQGTINREDMLELTRRMTVSRNCFHRIAGAYFDDEGYVDGSFNTHFQHLSSGEQAKNLAIAKAIPFAKTNTELKLYHFTKEEMGAGSVWQMLKALVGCELKNDAFLDMYYELISERLQMPGEYALYVFYGDYDIPRKGADHASQWESEEMYSFIIGAICPVSGDYEPGKPVSGFLFPAFDERSPDDEMVQVYQIGGDDITKILV